MFLNKLLTVSITCVVYTEVTWNIVHLTGVHSLYQVDALAYHKVSLYAAFRILGGSERNSQI